MLTHIVSDGQELRILDSGQVFDQGEVYLEKVLRTPCREIVPDGNTASGGKQQPPAEFWALVPRTVLAEILRVCHINEWLGAETAFAQQQPGKGDSQMLPQDDSSIARQWNKQRG